MVFGIEVTPETVLIAIVLWSLIWDLWARPILLRREIARYLAEEGGYDVVVGLMTGIARVISNPKDRAAFDEILRGALSGAVGAVRQFGKPPTWKEILAGGIAAWWNKATGGGAPQEGPQHPQAPQHAPRARPAPQRAAGDRRSLLRDGFRR